MIVVVSGDWGGFGEAGWVRGFWWAWVHEYL